MTTIELAKDSLIHVSALLGVSAMFFRSQLKLRLLLLASTVAAVLFYLTVPPEPMWGPIFWSAVMFAVNGSMVARLMVERTMFGLDDDQLRLFRAFGVFTPGEFRRLMKLAVWHEADGAMRLTGRGEAVDALYYVIDGPISVAKAGPAQSIEPGAFIGEVAFVKGAPASATVSVGEGARYVAWPRAALAELLRGRPAIGTALALLLNADMARKVAAA